MCILSGSVDLGFQRRTLCLVPACSFDSLTKTIFRAEAQLREKGSSLVLIYSFAQIII